MTEASPPPFAGRDFCFDCKSSFTFMTRRHHCRNCGESFCNKCSSFTDPLPHWGLPLPERTCGKCHEYLAKPTPSAAKSASLGGETPSRPAAVSASAEPASAPAPKKQCKCGMPLCICHEDAPQPAAAATATPAAKKAADAGAAASPAPRSLFPSATSGGGSSFQSFSSAVKVQYNLQSNLEMQCREAIKSGDVDGVQTLLEAKADANYCDHTGNTLLHVACIMGKFPIIKLLCEHGANPYTQALGNSFQETPYSVAPPALQFKIAEAWPRSRFTTGK